uniref:Uncharacterized protein n=2 Tax=unclassified Caudoviricetes TaxID=2788787 RepID=A0A8S5NNE8_9CAUD|nr:MAG TPA: hypothetical protein [Myoviridae sp. ctzRR1]DAD96233.1 MAG TPA: hypothetical protein [Myoviridae sp. ct0mM28]
MKLILLNCRRLYSIRIRVDKGDMAGRKKEESGKDVLFWE